MYFQPPCCYTCHNFVFVHCYKCLTSIIIWVLSIFTYTSVVSYSSHSELYHIFVTNTMVSNHIKSTVSKADPILWYFRCYTSLYCNIEAPLKLSLQSKKLHIDYAKDVCICVFLFRSFERSGLSYLFVQIHEFWHIKKLITIVCCCTSLDVYCTQQGRAAH